MRRLKRGPLERISFLFLGEKSIALQTLKPSPGSLGCTHLMLQVRRKRPREVRAAQGHRAENDRLVHPATLITSPGLNFLICQ